jgi:hypothetical protein
MKKNVLMFAAFLIVSLAAFAQGHSWVRMMTCLRM